MMRYLLACLLLCACVSDGQQSRPDWSRIGAAMEIVGQDMRSLASQRIQEGKSWGDLYKAADALEAVGADLADFGGEGHPSPGEALQAAVSAAELLLQDEAAEDPRIAAALTAMKVAAVLTR